MDSYPQELEFFAEEPHVKPVGGVHRLHNDQQGERNRSKKHPKKNPREIRHPKEYLQTMTNAASASNQKLAEKGLPYRFCVFEKHGRVIIDVVLLDKKGAIVEEIKRDITNEDFDRLIEDVASIEGLLIDQNG